MLDGDSVPGLFLKGSAIHEHRIQTELSARAVTDHVNTCQTV